MSTEFRWPNFEAVEVDDTFKIFPGGRGRKLVTNRRIAFEILAPGKKRDKLLADLLAQKKPEPKVDVFVPAVEEAAPAVVEQIAESVVQVDEQESKEFFNAMTVDNEPFVPDPDKDWFDCTLASRLPNAAVIIGELTNGQLVWIHERDFTVKNSGHSLCLSKGTKMAVRMERNTTNPRFQFRAIECQVQVIDDEKKESRATGEVLDWTGSLGRCRMDCSCSIAIGTPSRNEQLDLNVGDRVEFDIVFHHKKQKFLGANITVLATEEKKDGI